MNPEFIKEAERIEVADTLNDAFGTDPNDVQIQMVVNLLTAERTRTWQAALACVPETDCSDPAEWCVTHDEKCSHDGWDAAREALLQAALQDGVVIE